MAPTWLDASAKDAEMLKQVAAPPRLNIHPPPSASLITHQAVQTTQQIKARHAGFNGCLPCTTNFSRGDFAASAVAKTVSKMREFMLEPGAPRTACLPQPPLPHCRWSLPEMPRPRFCCWSRFAHRACAPPPLGWRSRGVRLHLGSRRLGGV